MKLVRTTVLLLLLSTGCVHRAPDDAGGARTPGSIEVPLPPWGDTPAATTAGDDAAAFQATSVTTTTPDADAGMGTGAWVGIGFGLRLALLAGGPVGAPAPGDGAHIQFVFMGSPAEHAGLQPGDVITALDGRAVRDATTARSTLLALAAGQTVQITYRRGATEQTVPVTAQATPRVQIATTTVVGTAAQRIVLDQRKLLQDALSQLSTACASFEQYAAQHPDDAQAQSRAKLCREEVDLTEQEMKLGIKQLELQQQSTH